MEAIAEKNSGYDFARFDRRVAMKEQISRERARASAKAKAARPAISGFSVISGVIVFVMLIALLYSYVNLTEASDINRQHRVQLEDLREENQMLEISRNQRMGVLQVRDWAVTKLGMSKINKSQITYVTTSGGDRFEIEEEKKEDTSKLVAGLAKGFSTIVEYIN